MRDLLTRLIAIVSRLVPAYGRRDFRAEWDAELGAAWAGCADRSAAARLRIARQALGSIPDALFLFRQQWSPGMLLQDLRYGLRILLRRRGYSTIVVLTLAVGVGATTAMFSVVNAVLLRPLPFPQPGQLVEVWENDRVNLKPRYPVAPANYEDWRTWTKAFDHLAAYVEGGGTLAAGEPFHASIAAVTSNFFDTIKVRPLLGRTFTPDEAVPPRHRVLVLSFSAWQSHFNGDAAVIGRTVQFNDTPHLIVGVMPRGFAYPSRGLDGWRPMAITSQFLQTRALHFLSVVGRIAPTATIEQARTELEAAAVAAQRAHPDTNDQRGTTTLPLAESIEGSVRRPIYLLGGAVGLLLLIAVVNVANLMLVESTARRRELAVRSALGADRFRIVRQLLVEGLLLAACGGILGIALAAVATRGIAVAAAEFIPRIDEVAIDWRVLAFGVLVSLAAGVCFAVVPAAIASRANVQQGLRDAARGAVGGPHRLRKALVLVEFSAAVVLVIGAALVLKSFWRLVNVAPGFATQTVLSADVDLPSRYEADPPIAQFYADLLARVSVLPGVRAAGIVNNLPVTGNAWTAWLTIEHAPRSAGEPPEVGYRTASPGYFATMQIPLLEGRGLQDSDTATAQKVLVVNRALADRFFAGGNALGARVRIGPNPNAPWRMVIGIAGNVRHGGPASEPVPEVFLPASQDVNGGMTLVVRTDEDPDAIVPSLRTLVRSVDEGVTLWRVRSVADVVGAQLAAPRLAMYLVLGFGAVALGLALLGIYGVMSCAVSERVPEIGVRLALGAAPGGILRMVVGDGLRLALPGLIAGSAIAAASSRLARALLFEVSPTDPAIFAAVIAAIAVVAAFACYLPARRAAGVDPLTAIRVE
ncbi:MAG: ABC transporter permease [Vicinamibacterales bacterium]